MVVSFAAVFRLLEKDLNCILNHEMRAEFFPHFSDGIKAAYNTSFVPPYTLPKVLLIYILLYIYSERFSFFFSLLFLLLPLLPWTAPLWPQSELKARSIFNSLLARFRVFLLSVMKQKKQDMQCDRRKPLHRINRVFHPCFIKLVYSNPDALTTLTTPTALWHYMKPKLMMCSSGSPNV